MPNLYTETKDLHHACEQHPVGAAMSDGSIGYQWWTDWVFALLQIHEVIDPELPRELHRTPHLAIDLESCKCEPREMPQLKQFVVELQNRPKLREAAHYVITGAHLMGGQVMKMKLSPKLPNAHLHFGNRETIMELWKPYRDRIDLADDAKEVFQWLLKIMDDIYDNNTQ